MSFYTELWFKLIACFSKGKRGIIDLCGRHAGSVVPEFFGSHLAYTGVIASTGGVALAEVLAVPAPVALNAGAFLDGDYYLAVSDECLAVGREVVGSRV